MAVSLSSPWWLVAFAGAGVATYLLWAGRRSPSGPGQRLASLSVRLAIFAALALALAGPEISSRAPSQTLVVASDLSASTASARSQEVADVSAIASALPSHDYLGVVTFGQQALVEDPPLRGLQWDGFATGPGPNFTDIEAGLRIAASIAVAGTRRHVVLISDGRENIGDAIGEARALRSEGVRVDVLPLQVHVGPDVRVDSVSVPSSVPPRTRVVATAVLVSNERTGARVVWSLDNSTVVADKVIAVAPGVEEISTVLPPAPPGFHEVSLEISPARDSVPGNNIGEALFQVLGPQRALVVDGQPGEGRNVAAALRSAGVLVDEVGPAAVPVDVAGVARWQAVALVDVSAAELGEARMAALADATRDLGVGLVAFGGPGSFGPGGWGGTPLETALPVSMNVENPVEKPPIAVMLVLETVESTAGDQLVREAADRLVSNLSPDDLVGVTDGETGVVVPLQRVGNAKHVEEEIASIPSFGDPQSYVPYMADAAAALRVHPAATKYMVVMGDGDAVDPLPSPAFMASLVRQGITVSTVGADVHGSPALMANMAEIAAEGKGRFYDSESAYELPSIFLNETHLQLQPWIVNERFRPVEVSPSPALSGIGAEGLPPLEGYVATTPKAASQVALAGPGGDPILASWQYGLGTAEAWTSDTTGHWTAELLRSPLAGKLFAGIVASTLPLQASPALRVTAEVQGDEAHLVAQVLGAPSDASAVAHVAGPDGSGSETPLVETAPGRFEGDIPTSEVGPYLMRVEVQAAGHVLDATTVGVAVAYSPELRYLGTDKAYLSEVAAAGGGVVLSSAREAASVQVPAVYVTEGWWAALLVLAAVLLPFDVALRRLDLRRVPAPMTKEPGPPRALAGDGRLRTGRVGAAEGGPGAARPREAPRPPGEVREREHEEEPVLASRLLERLKR
jgi:Mg-chelatase subunit ChlD